MNIAACPDRVKKFVSDHRTELTITASFAAGVVTTSLLMQHNPFVTTFLVTKPSMKKLEMRGGAVIFDLHKGREYALINSPF